MLQLPLRKFPRCLIPDPFSRTSAGHNATHPKLPKSLASVACIYNSPMAGIEVPITIPAFEFLRSIAAGIMSALLYIPAMHTLRILQNGHLRGSEEQDI
jgi:hypothetical protein